MIRNILFYIKEAFLSARKNGVISLATLVCLTATLIIVGILLTISVNINVFIDNLESQLVVIAYFKDNIATEEVGKIVEYVESLNGVKEVIFISKEEALDKLKEDLAEQADILAGLPENPLPSSLEIKVDDSSFLEDIASLLGQYKEIDEVNYGGELTKNLMIIFNFVRKSGITVIMTLLSVSLLIMFSVIKISIHSRQQEIEIMSLVGATGWFIRWPFIIEGFLKGLISSLTAIVVLNKIYYYFTEKVTEIIPFIPIALAQDFMIKISLILLLIGTLIGIFGSMLSLRKINFEEL